MTQKPLPVTVVAPACPEPGHEQVPPLRADSYRWRVTVGTAIPFGEHSVLQFVARDMIAPAMPHTRSLPLSLRFPNVHLAPRGPVPAQLEEIIEVREAKCLELLGEIAECIGIMERPDGDQLALHPEFGIGEIVA